MEVYETLVEPGSLIVTPDTEFDVAGLQILFYRRFSQSRNGKTYRKLFSEKGQEIVML